LPIVNITWSEAQNYCIWAGLKLPTEAQWEKAARGNDERNYPWGNTNPYKKNLMNYYGSSDGYNKTAPVYKYDRGISPYGCYNMAGNVSEWCFDWYDMEYYLSSTNKNPQGPNVAKERRVVRGGNWDNTMNDCVTNVRNSEQPVIASDKIGFRVAK